MKNKELTKYVLTFVNQLIASGVENVVISPGSRSTPLALILAEHPNIKTYINIDERSAGFFALGMAKQSGKPVALLCTSGTAAANYYPAIIEAHYARVPLLVLTADRPHELREVGAPQAIDQIHLYGKYVKWFTDAPVPEDRPKVYQYVKNIVSRGVFEAIKHPQGPVHLNVPFRAPLVPDLDYVSIHLTDRETNTRGYDEPEVVLSEATFRQLADRLQSVQKGWIVSGELHDEKFAEAVVSLAEQLSFPILADPLSQLRYGSHGKEMIIENYDTVLKGKGFSDDLKPEVVIRFGAMPVSKALWIYLQEHADIEQIVVDPSGGWRDPSLQAEKHIQCSESVFCKELSYYLSKREERTFFKKWKEVNDIVKQHIEDVGKNETGLFEGRLYIELRKLLPQACNIVIGNSMPIRDVDTYFQASDHNWKLYANRGANGIDGVVSTALGISAASDLPTYLVIGDLSFYHDLNGLLAGKTHHVNLTILLVNNNGGGIFSFLPQAKEKKHFETLFGTPTNLNFEHAAKMYDIQYEKVELWNQLHQYLSDERAGIRIIEIVTNRYNRVDIQRNFTQFVSEEIRKELKQ